MYGRVHEPEAKVLRLVSTSEDFLHEGAQEHHGVQDVWAPQVRARKKSQRHWHVSIKKKLRLLSLFYLLQFQWRGLNTTNNNKQQMSNRSLVQEVKRAVVKTLSRCSAESNFVALLFTFQTARILNWEQLPFKSALSSYYYTRYGEKFTLHFEKLETSAKFTIQVYLILNYKILHYNINVL